MVGRGLIVWSLLFATFGLGWLGLEGIGRADDLTAGVDLRDRQVTWWLLGVLSMSAAALVPASLWRKYAYAGLWLTLPLLVVVLFMPPRNGARCWIPLGPIDLQPSELAKVAFILALARYLEWGEHFASFWKLVPPLVLTMIPTGFILKEPDLGTAVLFAPVFAVMVYAAGASVRHLWSLALCFVVALPFLWMGMNSEQQSRIVSWVTQTDGGRAPRDDRWHQHQAKFVIVLGGTHGSAWHNDEFDDPAAYHLPAGRTDFVFCFVIERFGLWGMLGTLMGYLVLSFAGMLIAAMTTQPFDRLVAVGIVGLIGCQAAMNLELRWGCCPSRE